MIRILNEDDKVVCPICGKELRYLNNFHLKTHGYNSEVEFLRDYPEFKIKSNTVKSNILKHLNSINQDSERQSAKGKKGWTDDRRKQKSVQMTKTSRDLHTLDKYVDVRSKIYKNRFGNKRKYTTKNGDILNLRSKLERYIAYFLDSYDIDYEYEKLQIPYKRKDGSIHQYLPDFYLPKYNLVIEGKYSDEIDNEIVSLKKQATVNAGYRFLFIDENDIKDYKKLFSKLNKALDLK